MPSRLRVQKRLYYKIGEACRLLDIQPYVLRYWETEFPALSPAKSRSGQRVYNEKELAVIRRIKELLYDEGYTIAGAKKKLEGELAAGTLGRVEPDDADEVESTEVGEEGEEEAPEEGPAAAPDEDADSAEGAEQLALEAPPAPVARVVKPAPRLDTRGSERVETLRAGIEQALRAAREILALLDSKPPAK
ncbi:MAG TPA: MerR family transcriptional regulator [Thermoanaerobaculia bacterium]|nr:MerR family transcriptional regulator [Thermoanaerobaculia bacterium]